MQIFTLVVFLLGEAIKLSAQNEEYASTEIDSVTLRSSTGTSITASWLRPKGIFNHYRANITEYKVGPNGHAEHQSLGLCSFPNNVGHHEMPPACGGLAACRNVNLKVSAYIRGPPERTFLVTGMEGVFVPGHEPDPPSNITMVKVSPSITRIEWQPPAKVFGSIGPYTVKLCDWYLSCAGDQDLRSCTVKQTNQTWLEIENSAVTQYCVAVMASARCGANVLRSLPATAEIITPYYALPAPDVTNLMLAAVGKDFFKVTWERPSASIDTYWIEIVDISDRSNAEDTQGYGTCAGHLQLQPFQTELTCSNLKPCSNFSVTVGTRINRHLYVPSSGVTLAGIFTAEKGESEVSNLKIQNVTYTSFAVTWERPNECVEYYTVEVTDHSSGYIGDRHYSVVSCGNGGAIETKQTSITCTKSDTCTSISVRVKTHTRGPPEHASRGITLERVLIPGTELPELTNLKLVAVKNDSFTVTLQVPEVCVSGFYYSITDHNYPERKVKHETCFREKKSKKKFNRDQITCIGIEACGKVDLAAWSRKIKPHMPDPPRVALRGIFVRGKCNK